jgi:PIN domain nuclease of toxin-antitoxin system
MSVLIDTHAFFWFCEGNPALSSPSREAIENPANERYVSHVTPWEIAIKLGLEKIILKVPYEKLFPGALIANSITMLEPNLEHYLELIRLPFHHRDPFDRLLVAQAKVEKLALLTHDSSMSAYGIPLLW